MGFSVLGFWLFLIRFFGFAVLFGLRILRSLAYGLRDPILDSVRDPIRSGPIQIFVDAAGELFYCFVVSVDRQTPQMVACASSDLILLYAAMTTNKTSIEKMFLAFIAFFLLPSDLYVGKYLLFTNLFDVTW